MANYVVGDIQGCFDEFYEGLNVIKFNKSKDFLWVTGDLVNRGPKSLEVLKYVRKLQKSAHIVLGNHDLHFLNCYFNNILPKNNDTLIPLLRDKKVKLLAEFLLKQPLFFSKQVFIKNNLKNVGMVHAGIPETMSLKESEIMSRKMTQKLISNPKKILKKIFKKFPTSHAEDDIFEKSKFFTTVRSVDALGKPNYSYKGNLKNLKKSNFPWFKRKMKIMNDIDILVFGHWAALEGKTNISNVYAMDTGCSWGKELTFLRLEDNKKFKVKSKQK